ncbi:MAG TPA: diguanylate cyclase [Anaeromyxobacteraceae bacterium]|nr:diguanylate cyclase [Anaeromyxobacteraceae bacterium]
MPGRILVVEQSRPVLAVLRRDLLAAGYEIEVATAATAATKVEQGRHAAVVVRAAAGAEEVVQALRDADPLLPIIGLFGDEEEHAAHAAALGADATLVGPLCAPAMVASTCRLAERVGEQARRIADLERTRPPGPGAASELEFLKRLLFVEVKRSRRHKYPIALALVSLDRWDEFAAGLAAAARARLMGELLGVVTSAVRDIDVAVPFTEDRLLVLMPHTKNDGGLQVGRRLCARVRERVGAPAETVSVGVAAHHGEGPLSFSSLVRRASEALGRARTAGGDRAESADPPKKRDRISIG